MASWRKEQLDSYYKTSDYTATILVFLFIGGLVFKYTPFFVIFGIVGGYLLLNAMYEHTIQHKLNLHNVEKTIRLFSGEKETISFELHNQSKNPVINGALKFEIDDIMEGDERTYLTLENKRRNQYTTPTSFIQNGDSTVKLPLIAVHRGVAYVRNVSIVFPNPFNFEKITLHYIPQYKTRIIIYPKPVVVWGVEIIFQFNPGDNRTDFSLFTDVQSAVGTREYQSTDSIKRINWKASAKTQSLQSNIYPYIMDMSFVFIINLGLVEGTNIVNFSTNLERNLSYTAYLCQYATKKRYPFELYINARQMGRPAYIHVPENSGNAHLARILEILAMIRRQTNVYPFRNMLHTIEKNHTKQQSLVIVGDVTDEDASIIDQWKIRQGLIYHVRSLEEVAYLKEWSDNQWRTQSDMVNE